MARMPSRMAKPPHTAYAVIMGAFASGLAGAGLLAKALGRDPQEHRPIDLAILGIATFKGARTISRDEVTSFLRDPFVEGEAHEGGEDPVESGDMRQAIGELVTCTRCIGTWVAAGDTGGTVTGFDCTVCAREPALLAAAKARLAGLR